MTLTDDRLTAILAIAKNAVNTAGCVTRDLNPATHNDL